MATKKPNIVDIKDFSSLNEVELGAVISFLIEYNCKIDLVKERMLKVYDRRVSAETIKRVLHKKEDYIKNAILEIREDLQSCHFYHLPARMREWERLYWECLRERVVNSCKVSEDEYELIEKPDLSSAASVLKGMASDVANYEKLLVDKHKAGYDDDDDEDSGNGSGAKIADGGGNVRHIAG